MGFKRGVALVLIILILITNILAVTVVEVNKEPPKPESHWYDFLK